MAEVEVRSSLEGRTPPVAQDISWRLVVKLLLFWGSANLLVMWSIDAYETRALSAEHEVPYGVLRQCPPEFLEIPADKTGREIRLGYRVRSPSFWAAKHSVPLLVFLHGAGERGYDNARQCRGPVSALCAPSLKTQFPCALLVPQCPEQLSWTAAIGGDMRMSDAVLQMIDKVLEDERIDPDRIYLAGYSMGAFGTWRLAAQAPKRFAAAVPMAGGATAELAGKLIHLPIWAAHSVDDGVVPVDGTRTIINAIRDAGGTPAYLEVPDAGHAVWKRVLVDDSEVLTWMFQQSRAQQARLTQQQ